jgi:YVTN family beta-propeller protein
MVFKQKTKLYFAYAALLLINNLYSSPPNAVTSTVLSPNFHAPTSISINPIDGSKAYVINSAASSNAEAISIIDVATNTVTGYVQDPDSLLNSPTYVSIAPNGTYAYALSIGDPNTINYISVSNDTVTQNANGNMSFPFINLKAVGYTLDSSTAYIADAGSLFVPLISGNNEYNRIYTGIYATNLAISGDGSRMYTTDGVSSLAINNTGTYGLINTFSIPGAGAIAFDPASPKAYISSTAGVTIMNVTMDTYASPSTVTGADPSPTDIVFTPDGSTAYLIYSQSNSISIVDVATDTVIDTVPNLSSSPLNEPTILAITPDGSKGYLTNRGATAPGLVSVLTDPPFGGFSPSILPPSAIGGCKTQNRFLLQTDYINNLTWTAPISGTIPASYQIYRDAYLSDLVATVPSSSTLQYYDHGRNPNVTYTYYIVSVDGSGNKSEPASVTVTNHC